MNIYRHQSSNIAKTWALLTGFFLLVIGFGWLLAQYFGNPAIVTAAVFISVLMSFMSYWFSDRMVLAMTNARPVARRQAPELYNIVENLAIAAGLPMPTLYIVNDPAPNAFATGRNPAHAVVAVTTGLLERLDRAELEGVVAHELSHIGNWDMLVSTVAAVLVGFISIAGDFALRSMLWGGGRRDRENASGALMAVFAVVGVVLVPIAAMIMQMAISRRREFLADASGALLTRYPEGLASALLKISADPHMPRAATSATAHLWFENPFKADARHGRGTPWFVKLFMTHPPVDERVRALRGMQA
jgi:heat shock protein HtpX